MAQKLFTCPKCRALLEPGTKACPYCQTDQRYVQAPTAGTDATATSRLGLWLVGAIGILYFLMVQLDPLGPDDERPFEPSHVSRLHFGDSRGELMVHCGQYWRVVSAMFLHADLMHLAFNAVAIMILIPAAAVTFGLHRTLCLYFTAGVFSFAISQFQGGSAVGASGAICGLITALAVYGKRRGGFEGRMLMRRMLTWMAVIVIFGFLWRGRNIDNLGHGAGFAVGAVLGWPAAAIRVRGGFGHPVWRTGAFAWIGIAVAVAAIAVTPSVLRGLERSDVIAFEGQARSAIVIANNVARGIHPTDELPESIDDGPAGTEVVVRLVNDALAATHRLPLGAEAADARDVAMDALVVWRDTLSCRYPYLWSTGR